eukprot:10425425-Alexandrium_andersonii.AAC.1
MPEGGRGGPGGRQPPCEATRVGGASRGVWGLRGRRSHRQAPRAHRSSIEGELLQPAAPRRLAQAEALAIERA